MGSKGSSSQPQYLPTVQNTSQSQSGSSQSTQNQTTQPDPLAGLAYTQVLANANQIAQTPFQPYQGQMVAGFTPDTMASFQGIRNMQGIQNPYLSQSGNLYQQSTNTWQNPFLPKAEGYYGQSFGYIPNTYMGQVGNYASTALNQANNPYLGTSYDWSGQSVDLSNLGNFNQQALNRYTNPYQQSVVDATLAQMKQNQDVLQNQNTANAIRQGAYGGSGQFMGQAELGRQQALANAQTLAGLNAQNYQQAMAQYNQQQQQAIQARQQAAQTMGQLGQSQAGLLAQTGMGAAQLYGDLGNQLAQRGIQAYQNAANNLGQLGQAQQALGVNALQGAAQGVAGLGKQAQQAAITDATALQSIGEQQRQLQQQQLTNAYNQWLQAQAYPYQQTSYFAGLAGGLGPLMGSTVNAQSQATSQGSTSGSSSGIQPYQQPQQGGGQIPGLITTGLGLLGNLFGFKDGGRVGYADGGEADDESFGEAISKGPYSGGTESPTTSKIGLGSLMSSAPYTAPDDYIGEATKLQKVIKPASQAGRERLLSKINETLDMIPEFRKFDPDLGGGSMEGYTKYPKYTGETKGGDWGDVAKSVGKLAGSESFKSGVSSGLGSLSSILENFDAGGRVGYADGGTPAEQYQRSQQAQQQAQQIKDEYQKYFGRAPEQGGFEYWANLAAKGMSPEERVGYFKEVPERTRALREAFVDYLGRAPTVPEYADYANKLKQGISFGDLQKAIKQTPESLYRNMLGRPGEPGGLAYWNALQGKLDPTHMELYFADTPEYKAKMQQPSTPAEKLEKGWAALDPSAGMDKAQAREKMIAPLDLPRSNYDMLLRQARKLNPGPQLTPEQQGMPSLPGPEYYTSRTPIYSGMGATVGAVPNYGLSQSMTLPSTAPSTAAVAEVPAEYSTFINSLFKTYYNRDPSEEERNAQYKILQSGKKPAELEVMFQSSPEGRNTQYIQNMYKSTLGRPADLGGLQYWKDQLSAGMPAIELGSRFKDTEEYTSVPPMFRSTAPVQGYYTQIADNQFNPVTGLYNLKYTAPYRSNPVQNFLPRKDGGRVEKAAGGALGGKDLYNYLVSLGANDKEAAMLTGMAKTESGFNPYVMHDQNTGFGLWGHGKDRWADMQKYTGERKPGWQDQAKFALWELRNSPKVSLARQALNKADDARDVAIAGMHFERPRGYTAAAPWMGMNWRDRFSNVENLMLGRDLGKGPELRIAEGKPSSDSMMFKNVATPATSERPRGLIPRILAELAPVKSAEAAESVPTERKSMFAWPELRNPRMATLPEALGRPNWPNAEPGPLPVWKKEVQVGFGPLQGEKPADERQVVEPLTQEVATPLPPRRPDNIVAEDSEGKSKQKYWGDWRDTEPFKSDPIGGFFDTLMGDKPKSDKPGELYRSSRAEEEENPLKSIGELFSFADGGVARHGYALGGEPVEEEGFDPLGSLGSAIESGLGGLGDTIGGLFGEGKDAGSAEEAAIVASDRIPSKRGMSPLSESLLAAGLGMLAAPTRDPWQAVGMGGLRGLQVYETASEQARKQEEAAAKQAAAEEAANRYQRQISGLGPVSEDQVEEKEAAPAPTPGLTPKPLEITPIEKEPEAEPSSGVVDIEADPSLRRLTEQYARVASMPAPTGLQSVKTAQLSNLKFQIEERRRQLESSVRARKEQQEAAQSTPEAKARAKQLEVSQEALAKESVATEQAARQADQRIATLNRMKDAVSSGKFRTGAFAEKELALKKAVQSVFPSMVDEEAIAMAEQFDKDALQAVTDATGGKLGAGVSDADVRFLTRQQAGLGTTKAGNVRTLDAAIKIEQRKKDIANFARDYKNAHGGVLDQGYYQELSRWADEHPMFVEEKTSKPGALTADTVPEGHEIQRGNATYRWDSSSKKYKRVQ